MLIINIQSKQLSTAYFFNLKITRYSWNCCNFLCKICSF